MPILGNDELTRLPLQSREENSVLVIRFLHRQTSSSEMNEIFHIRNEFVSRSVFDSTILPLIRIKDGGNVTASRSL